MDIESRSLLSYQKIEYISYFVIFSAMLLYEKQSSMVRLANLEFEQDPTCPQDLLKVLIQGMSLLQESKTSLDLEPAASLMSKYLAVVNEDIKELSGYIEMVRELI